MMLEFGTLMLVNFDRAELFHPDSKERTMMKRVFTAATAGCLFCLLCMTVSAQLINEVDINPAGTDQPCEYIELRGTPGAIIENVHFVAFEGDAAPSGTADFVVTFGSPGPAFGTNGLIVITGTAACGARSYPAETIRLQTALLDAQNGLENGTISLLLISSATAITPGTDYDTDNNGTLEGLPTGATILDAVAWNDGGSADITYGGVTLTAMGGTIGAATRFVNNSTPLSAAAWYAGSLVDTNDSTNYSPTVRTLNFPAEGALTPGAPNIGNAPKRSPVDFNGDGLTDYVTVRAAGGLGSQLTWFTQFNGGSPYSTRDWGISGDQLLTGDIDGDGTDDIVIFRDSNATFYVLLTATQTMRIVPFGQSGDDPRVIGDYDGDGRDDIALYRAGSPSTWFYKPSLDSTFRSVGWGEASDKPAPGDYDGDGKNDFVVRRGEAGAGRFYSRYANDTFATQNLGLPNDKIAPADYDGDGKTDLCVVRINGGGFYDWQFISSLNGSTVTDEWGVAATDILAPGDYDGDGKADYSVWRQGSPGTFFTMTVGDRRIFSKLWGEIGDAPVAASATF